MKNLAWALSGGFGIDQLRLEERPRREPGHGEARVRIEWISLNRRDLLLVEGVYNPRQKLPIVPCSDGAGVIEATGAGCEQGRGRRFGGDPLLSRLDCRRARHGQTRDRAGRRPRRRRRLAADDRDLRTGAGSPAAGHFDRTRLDLALRRPDGLVGGGRPRRRRAGIGRRHAGDRRRLAVRAAVRQDAGRARRRDDFERGQGRQARRTRRRRDHQLPRRARLGAARAGIRRLPSI